jgi:hypothetical protein
MEERYLLYVYSLELYLPNMITVEACMHACRNFYVKLAKEF